MKKNVLNFIKKAYGILIMISFFGGLLPLIAFLVAFVLGGEIGESVSLFLFDKYYPVIIAMASLAIIVGLIGMYLSKEQSLSIKTMNKK